MTLLRAGLTTHCSGLAAQRCLYRELIVRLAAEFGRYALLQYEEVLTWKKNTQLKLSLMI